MVEGHWGGTGRNRGKHNQNILYENIYFQYKKNLKGKKGRKKLRPCPDVLLCSVPCPNLPSHVQSCQLSPILSHPRSSAKFCPGLPSLARLCPVLMTSTQSCSAQQSHALLCPVLPNSAHQLSLEQSSSCLAPSCLAG